MKSYKFKFLMYFLLVILFSGCFSPSSKHSYFPESDRNRYEEFFKKFLFLEDAVYTLYGSKPMTEIVLFPETTKERIAMQNASLKKLSKSELAELKATSFDYDEVYCFEETWAMWEEMLKTLPIKRYLFVERKVGIPLEFQKNRYMYFINIKETASVLQNHYSLFREYVGFDFDPLSVVFDAKNPESPFWNAVWGRENTDKGICLIGILFGYGFENSYPFSWHFTKEKSPEEMEFIKSVLRQGLPTISVEALKRFNPPESFLLPGFTSFSDCDPHKEKYKQEYEIIRQIYNRSDIINCTMYKLLH